jgi:amidohydrolase
MSDWGSRIDAYIDSIADRLRAIPWSVPWRTIFQPAEETTQGAQEMIEAGAMQGVKYIVALHVDPERAVGRIGLRRGYLTAACEELHATIQGEGGHAARPHHTIDSIAVATHFVSAIYQFIPRSVDSRDPVVVSFGMIQGGANANVIPERVQLKGTLRTLGRATGSRVKERILAVAHGISEASRARVDVLFRPGADSVVNDGHVTGVCEEAASTVVGREEVMTIPLPSMGSEDFSAYLAHAPGCMMRLGAGGDPGSQYFLHSPRFDIDERALTLGAKILARSAILLPIRVL